MPLLPSKSLDTLEHHCVTCRCGGDVTTRHNALRNGLHTTFHHADLSALNRVAAVVVVTSLGRVLLTYWWLTGIEVCQQHLMSQ